MDTSQEDEPCTQPLGEDEHIPDSQESLMDTSNILGYLIPLKPKGPMIPIDKERTTVGRSVKCDIVIKQQAMKNVEAVSKEHFAISFSNLRHDDPVLEDKSSNGTFVNGKIVGKGRKTVLKHNDSIGMALRNSKHFIFMSTNSEYVNKYPLALREKYTISRELGKGACGTVVLGIRNEDQQQLAIKIIDKKVVTMRNQNSSINNIMNEVNILKRIDHPCIIKLEDVIESDTQLFIILELAQGGELFDKIVEKTKIEEKVAKIHFYQIASAIKYLHSKNIAHRDLKPENILLCSDDDDHPIVKVTDLGLSKFVDIATHLKTFCGTPQYLAPEVLYSHVRKGTYGKEVDMWSLGVLLYILLCGYPPFNPDRSDKPLAKQITDGDYSFPKSHWESISPEAIDLVKKLMTVNHKARLTAAQALEHPWMLDKEAVAKATSLMDSQKQTPQSPHVSCLDGILPEELDLSNGDTKMVAEKNEKMTAFKRPKEIEESSDVPCAKRTRVSD